MRLDEFDNMDEGAQPAKKPNSKEVYRNLDQQERSANLRDYDRPKNTKDRLKTKPMAGPRGPIPEAELDEVTRLSGRNQNKGDVNHSRFEKNPASPEATSKRNAIAADARAIRAQGGGKALNKSAGRGQSMQGGGEVYTSKMEETTGDEKFDSMMGKISGNTEPQNFNQAQNDRVQDKAAHPDAETINALNKMMYDMHVTMQTANRLMQKLTRGQ